ncbi:MAG: NnrS family protein [Burkholderiales bacterium]|nr:NnrS family protein [Burkholderiales bacterium]
MRVWARLTAHPVFLCGFRPFYLATAAYGLALMLVWAAMLAGWLPAPPVPGGAVAWHARELIHGYAYAAVAGFLLTAVPEFTATPAVVGGRLLGLALVWLAARLAYALSGWIGPWPAVLGDLAFLLMLARWVAPPIWRDPSRAHRSLLYALAALILLAAGERFGAAASAWRALETGVLMVLIVLAQSRISMRLINGILQARGVGGLQYLARPPRRNLAVAAIAAHTAVHWVQPVGEASGWLALAAGAALLNLTNDWHIGRHLFVRWVFALYLVYWSLAVGYALLGLAVLTGLPIASAGWHLLLAGGMSLAIFVVMAISGRMHAGHRLDPRPWVPAGVALIVLAALLRALAAWPQAADWAVRLWLISALAWAGAFALFLWAMWPLLTRPRPDTGEGCAGPVTQDEGDAFAC